MKIFSEDMKIFIKELLINLVYFSAGWGLVEIVKAVVNQFYS